MAVIEVNRNPTRRELNLFGFIWLGFFLLLAGALWLKIHALPVPLVLGCDCGSGAGVWVGCAELHAGGVSSACRTSPGRSVSWSPTFFWGPYTTCCSRRLV